MGNHWTSFRVRADTKELLEQVRIRFISEYPETEGMNLTQDFLIKRAFNFFLK